MGIWYLVILIAAFLIGIPVAISMGGSAAILMMLERGLGAFRPEVIAQKSVYGLNNFLLLSIPLFLYAGKIMNTGNITSRIFDFAKSTVGWLRGGLGHVNIIASVIFAGMTGTATSDAAGLGAIEIKAMREAGYEDDFTFAVTGVSSTIGPIIPPSIPLVIYGLMTGCSIGALLIAGIVPGILLALLFMGYIAWWAIRNPGEVPAADPGLTFREKLSRSRHLIPVMLLIGAVLGSIYTGIATATEAAAVGVVGALILSALQGSLSRSAFMQSLLGATRLYCMIALILAGAQFLTLAMGYIGLPRALAEWIGGLGLSQFGLIMALMVFFIVLGCFLDGISIVVLTMGVLLPTVQAAGIDLIWFGIFIVFVVEMAQITPPVGFNLFVLSGMSGRELPYIARASLPMFFLMILAVLVLYLVPGIATWLPLHMTL